MLLATDTVHAAHRARFWRDVCHAVVEVDCHIDHDDFRGALQFASLGDLPAFLVQMDRCQIHRTPEQAARAVEPPVLLIYQASGAAHGEAAGGMLRYGAGEFILLDTAVPFRVQIEDGTRQFVLPLARGLIGERLGDHRTHTGRTIGASTPVGQLTCSFLSSLQSIVLDLDPVASRIAEHQLLDLVALALSRDADRSRTLAPSYETALAALNAALDEAVRHGLLDPETVAGRAGLTVAHANLLLRRERTTLADALRARHFDDARRRLEETPAPGEIPDLAGETEPALACGDRIGDEQPDTRSC